MMLMAQKKKPLTASFTYGNLQKCLRKAKTSKIQFNIIIECDPDEFILKSDLYEDDFNDPENQNRNKKTQYKTKMNSNKTQYSTHSLRAVVHNLHAMFRGDFWWGKRKILEFVEERDRFGKR